MFFPSALPWEILADIVAPSQKSKALWSQNIVAVALTCMSAGPASRLWGPLIREHPLSSDFPTFFASDSLGALTQIHYWVPAPLKDPDIFREPVWPAPEVSLHWPKGSQDNPDSWLSQLSLHLEWPYVTPFWPVRHQRKSFEVWEECSGKHSTS